MHVPTHAVIEISTSISHLLLKLVIALLGLIFTLIIPRRRVWIRVGKHDDGRTMVEYGLLARGEDHGLSKEAVRIGSALTKHWKRTTTESRQEKS